jgi:halimadienyl-diphosphate synthase
MKSLVQELLKKIDNGKVSSTAYDTAWVARLGEIDWELSSQALNWLCEHQLSDGSWGAEQPFCYHDRVVSTLSAMIALTYRGRRNQDRLKIEKGLVALERITNGATEGLKMDPIGGTVGFEMIAPTLVAEAERLGIIQQQGEKILGRLKTLRLTKMKKLAGLKISRSITAAHSAEMAGSDSIHLLDVDNIQEVNGSVSNNPAATAYFASIVKPGDKNALDYLRNVRNRSDGGIPSFAPLDIFERVWILWNLSLAKLHNDNDIKNLCLTHSHYLEKKWQTNHGLGFASTFSLTDGDDTSVGFDVITKFGGNVDLDAVLKFEEAEWFRCYGLEITPSIDVNLHVLGALKQAGYKQNHPAIKKILRFIKNTRRHDSYWQDKWNISPYYTTSHVIIECLEYEEEMCSHAVEWTINAQKIDGSWGFNGFSTPEETAYCIQALKIWEMHGKRIPKERLKLAKSWLKNNLEGPHPPLWIDKSLYSPELIVQSVILSALSLLED